MSSRHLQCNLLLFIFFGECPTLFNSLCLRLASCYSRQETWGGWGFESSSKSFNSVTATVFRVLKEIVNIHAEEKEGEEEKVL